MLPFLVQGLALGFAATAQPGPFMAYLISQTMTYGFRRTWIAAFAPLLSDGPIIALALLVLSQLPSWLQRGLHIASGLFILYLAWGTFQQWKNFGGIQVTEQAAPVGSRSLTRAALMNAINPLPYVYWSLVTGPILLAGWRESPAHGLAFLISFYTVLIGGLLGIMAIFGATRAMGERVTRLLLGISTLALVVFGLLQLWRGALGN
jgi:threonine/homoserine/homoserine lactone efflux protein